jgi:hypothetical protein
MRKGGGFGLILLIVVMAVILLLATRAWKAVMPTASRIQDPAVAAPVPDHGQSEAAEELGSPGLPNLDEMRENTSNHAEQMQELMEQANQ